MGHENRKGNFEYMSNPLESTYVSSFL